MGRGACLDSFISLTKKTHISLGGKQDLHVTRDAVMDW